MLKVQDLEVGYYFLSIQEIKVTRRRIPTRLENYWLFIYIMFRFLHVFVFLGVKFPINQLVDVQIYKSAK